ncbi:MAG: CdaR family protein [Verrucomicrobiota bacterium]|nr:CdaR family protein [Verrucomicrobiota bacterium]
MFRRETILNHFWWKVTSFLLAIIVWFTFQGAKGISLQFVDNFGNVIATRAFVNHRLTIMRAPNDKRDFRIIPETVDITVVGEDLRRIKNLSAADIQAYVDLTLYKTGTNTAQVNIFLPPEIRIRRIDPQQVQVELVTPVE